MDMDEMENSMKDSPEPKAEEEVKTPESRKSKNEDLIIEAKNFFDFHKNSPVREIDLPTRLSHNF